MMNGFLFGPGYYTSWIMFVLPAVIVSIWAQSLIKSRFAKYSQVASGTDYNGCDVARTILDRNGLTNVRIERVAGQLSDHYDPRTKVLRLSSAVYDGNDIAAFGVAAHEVGHAIQDAEGYVPLKLRNSIVPVVNIGNKFVWILIFIGFAFSGAGSLVSEAFIQIAIALFLAVVFFQVITLPVEIDASKRALVQLENGILSYEKVDGAKKVLQAAAMTYIAAILVSIGELLRILSYVNRRRD